MGTGTQARQLHSPGTGLRSLCACVRACACARAVACVRGRAPGDLASPPLLAPRDARLHRGAPRFWAGVSSQRTSQLGTG